jgi:hypothetical protein
MADNELDVIMQEHVKHLAEEAAKEIVERVYAKIQAKIGIHLAIYESHCKKQGASSTWFQGQMKRYKHLLNHISFVIIVPIGVMFPK